MFNIYIYIHSIYIYTVYIYISYKKLALYRTMPQVPGYLKGPLMAIEIVFVGLQFH